MTIDNISRNALHLWQIMNDGSTWSYDRIVKESHLSDREIALALGWLAREDSVEIILEGESGTAFWRIRQFSERGY